MKPLYDFKVGDEVYDLDLDRNLIGKVTEISNHTISVAWKMLNYDNMWDSYPINDNKLRPTTLPEDAKPMKSGKLFR